MKRLNKKIKLLAIGFIFSLFTLTTFASVNYSVTSDWGSAFQGQFTITNETAAPMEDFSMEFHFPYNITSIWDAKISSKSGDTYTVTLPAWKASLSPGEKYSFGFIASPGNATTKPSNIKINGSSSDPEVNINPTVKDDSASTTANSAVIINPLENDTTPAGSSLFLAAISQPLHGSAAVNGNSVTYTPAKDYTGTDSFQYTAGNSLGGSASATVTITVKPAASPESNDVVFKVVSDWGSGFNADITIKNNTSSAFSGWTLEFDFPHNISSLWNGTIVSHTGNHYVVKDSGWNASIPAGGSVTIGFGAAPGGTITAPYNIKLNGQSVTPEDTDKPVANNDTASVDQDSSVVIDVLKNDQGTGLTISKVSAPSKGTAVISDSKIVYTPENGYFGSDSFSYTIKDNKNQEATASVTVTIFKAVEPEAPVANDVYASTGINSSIIIDALGNDTPGDGTLSITSVTQPQNGSALIESNKIRYTPKDNFSGTDLFSYTIKDGNGLTSTAFISVFVGSAVTSDKVNATYWSLWGGNTSYSVGGKTITSSAMPLDQIDSSYNLLILAFIVTDSQGNFHLSYNLSDPANEQGLYTPAQVKEFISNAKAQGRKVIVSVGGEKFHMNVKNEAQKQQFATQIEKIIDDYGFQGLDLDFEAGSFSSDPALVGQAVTQIVNKYRNSGKEFYLTAAPEWCYIVPFAWGSGQWSSHSLAGDFYINLIKTIGVDNFSYIWPQTYNQGPANGIIGKNGEKVTPSNGMDNFLAAMVWAGTTPEGFAANGSIGLLIPPSKFALGIPATEGAAGGEMAYIATPALISSACSIISQQGLDFAGFMNWAADWDALRITDGQLSPGYTHESWETGRAIASALNIIVNPTPIEDQDIQAAFSTLSDGQIINLSQLEPIHILLNLTGNLSDIASITIKVDGVIYDGADIMWTPNSFGSRSVVATITENSGKTTVLSINVTVSQEEVSPITPKGNKQIIGYITQWDAWKGENYGLPAKGVFNQLNVDYSKYTIINFSFFGLANDGSLHSADFRNKAMTATNTTAEQSPAPLLNEDIYSSWDLWMLYGDVQFNWNTSPAQVEKVNGGAPGLFDLCKENNVKLMASIGGWSMSKHFSDMANSATMKARFLNDCKTLIDMGFDGIDIDWEYPGTDGMNFTGKSYDYANFATLMRDIRATIGPDKLLTAAFSAAPSKLNDFDWTQLSAHMDYFNIMSYDLEGGWSDNAGHNSALYGSSNQPCWDNTFKFLTEVKGVNPEKINMGVASYGRGVETASAAQLNGATKKSIKSFSVDGSLNSAADFANWGLFEGVPNYGYIVANQNGWFYHWDNAAKVPYLTKDNYFLSFDNPESVELKADYINKNSAGGVIIWQVFGDMQFEGGVSYVNPSIKKLPKADKVTTPLLDVLHNKFNL